MPLHHFLPATYLASFSVDQTPERRNRLISVGDKKTGRIFSAPVSKLCGINDLYTLRNFPENPQLIDSIWNYESRLAQGLENLICRTLNAMTWANTLIPFVTDLLVRGPDFNQRFVVRIESLGLIPKNPDNTNLARMLERQNLFSSVAAAKWIVVHKNGDVPVITNDLGYTTFRNPRSGDFGIAIPVGLDHILCISPKYKRALAFGVSGVWVPIIDYVESPVNDHLSFNQAITHLSQRFIFGPDSHSIEIYLPKEKTEVIPAPEPRELGFMVGVLAMVHNMTWFKLLSALSESPKDGTYIFVDYFNKNNIPPDLREDIFDIGE